MFITSKKLKVALRHNYKTVTQNREGYQYLRGIICGAYWCDEIDDDEFIRINAILEEVCKDWQ